MKMLGVETMVLSLPCDVVKLAVSLGKLASHIGLSVLLTSPSWVYHIEH